VTSDHTEDPALNSVELTPPAFDSDREYSARLDDSEFWAPYVSAALRRSGFPQPERIWSGQRGTYPTFQCDLGLVVKLYGESWSEPESFAAEAASYRLLAGRRLPVPEVAATGSLWPAGSGWGWSYLVTTRLPGTPMGLRSTTRSGLELLADELGEIVARLHRVPLSGTGRFGSAGPHGRSVPEDKWAQAETRQRAWRHLDEPHLSSMQSWLACNWSAVASLGEVAFLHGDLHDEHVFVDEHGHISGIIDFTDSFAGDPHFDLVPIHLGTFHADKELLCRFLGAYGWPPLQPEWPQLMMALTLVNEFDVLGHWKTMPRTSNLDDLALALWDLDGTSARAGMAPRRTG
jgi:hygromycin-B 7''-O-kinase